MTSEKMRRTKISRKKLINNFYGGHVEKVVVLEICNKEKAFRFVLWLESHNRWVTSNIIRLNEYQYANLWTLIPQ